MAKLKNEEDRAKRIDDLKRRAEELADGQMESGFSDGCPSELEESFWEQVVKYEEAPWTTNFQQLEEAGMALPPPDSLSDEELTKKLWEVIHGLALLRVFLEETDHLSDRELYTQLWTEYLHEETKAFPMTADTMCHLQMLGSGSEEDNELYLKYYADEDFRSLWQRDFPEDPIPPHQDPPYDRDRLLPKPDYGVPTDREPN
jgi:hypothetical protein